MNTNDNIHCFCIENLGVSYPQITSLKGYCVSKNNSTLLFIQKQYEINMWTIVTCNYLPATARDCMNNNIIKSVKKLIQRIRFSFFQMMTGFLKFA